MIYGASIVTNEYNFFITSQEFTIFKFSFLIGFGQLFKTFMNSVITFPTSNFNIYSGITIILSLQGFMILYNFCVCFKTHWQIGVIFFLCFFGVAAVSYIF